MLVDQRMIGAGALGGWASGRQAAHIECRRDAVPAPAPVLWFAIVHMHD